MIHTLGQLVSRWRDQAAAYEQDGQPGASLLRRVATDLEGALRQHALEELTPTEAAREEGCNPSTIRRRFPGRRRVTRAELRGKGRGGPDIVGEILPATRPSQVA